MEMKCKLSYRVLFIIDAVLLLVIQLLQGAALNVMYVQRETENYTWATAFVLDVICFIVFVVTFIQAYRYFTRKSEEKTEQKSNVNRRRSFMHSSSLPFFHASWIIYSIILVAKLMFIFNVNEANKQINAELLQVCLASASFVFLLLVEAHNWHKKGSTSFSYVFDLGKKTGIEIFDSVDMLEILIKKDYVSFLMESIIFSLTTMNFLIPILSLLQLRESKFGEKISSRSLRIKIMHSATLLLLIDIPFFIVRFYFWFAFGDLSMFMMKNLFNMIVIIRALYLDLVTYNKPAQAKELSKTEEIPLNQTEQTQTDKT